MSYALITRPCPWPDCGAPMTYTADDLVAAEKAQAPLRCDACEREAGATCRFELHAYVPPLRLEGDEGPGFAPGDDVIVLDGGE